MDGIIQAYKEGGVFMYFIAVVGVAVIGLAVARARAVFFGQVQAAPLLQKFEESVLSGDMQGVIRECDAYQKSPVCRVVKAAAIRVGRDEEHIGYALRAVMNEENPKTTKGLAELPLLANVATLFGLLGTITGLVLSFKSMAGLDPTERQQMLARGISEAMNCTASGLLVAVIALLINAVLYSRSMRIVNETNTAAQRVLEILTSRVYQRSKKESEGSLRGVA